MAKMIDLHFGFHLIPLIQLNVSIRKYNFKSSWLSLDLDPKYLHCIRKNCPCCSNTFRGDCIV